MTGFIEPHPNVISPNPGGIDDPLGESILDLSQPWLRVFEPRDRRVVIGRHQDPARELLIDHAVTDGVPIHRRVSGGGAVVLAPGMVVVAIRLENRELGTTCYLDRVNTALRPAVAAVCGVQPVCRGHGDLAMAGADGVERKVLGASLRQTSKLVFYLGVFLVDDAVPLMERYLAAPSRQPEYRSGRGHGAFCTHLAVFDASVERLTTVIQEHGERILGPHAAR
jgi:lipoate---protein ligase